ncbi:MAG TPA: sugar transferase [Blastocatellia bacterium]|nr:sugar transferase [Blastocatellia bacterium]
MAEPRHSVEPRITNRLSTAGVGPLPVSATGGRVVDRVRRALVLTAAAMFSLAVIDTAIALLALPVAYWLRQRTPVLVWPESSSFPVDVVNSFRPYIGLVLAAPIVRFFAMKHYGLYKLRGQFTFLGDALALAKAVSVGTLIIVLLAFLYRGGFEYRDYSYSRGVFVYDWAIVLVTVGAIRLVVRGLQVVQRQNQRNLIPTLIVGDGELAKLCVQEIGERSRLGYRVVGAVTARSGSEALTVAGVPVLGTFDSLPTLVRSHGIEEVMIADTELSPQALFEAIMRCGRTHNINFRVVPNLFNCLPRKTDVDQIGSLPMIKLFEEPLSGPARFVKRSVDIVGALTAIAITSPAWAVLAYLIRRESPGPVFKAQERVGMDGKVFPMIKFRSMRIDAESPENVAAHLEAMRRNIEGDVEEGELYGKVANDPRITRIGEWMRRFSVDEWPQMLNVLRGEMSLIGPRPPLSYEVEMYADWHRARFHVKPGITGLWQVSGRNRLPFQQMVQLDIYYIENWSLWLDLKILLKTIPVVLRGDNTN